MDGFLHFLSDVILLTAGLGVCLLWLVVFVAIAIEIYDAVIGDKKRENQTLNEMENYDA